MKIDLYSGKQGLDYHQVPLDRIKTAGVPAFAQYQPDLAQLKEMAAPYNHFSKILLIGNGGSITSFWAFYKALAIYRSPKQVEILSTMDPDFVDYIKENFGPEETLIIPISKSGNTVGVLEDLFAFEGYTMLPITSEGKGALYQIAVRRGLDYLVIPEPIGGRFSGRTPCGYFPAILCGIDIEGIEAGAQKMYQQCHPSVGIEDNPALKVASFLYLLDQAGYSEIFAPIYSLQLIGFNTLLVQLIHESSCKEGRGQTIYGSFAPESQHHTNQRFFGGRQNVVGFFVIAAEQTHTELITRVPTDLAEIPLGDHTLGNLSGIPLSAALRFEYEGTKADAEDKGIPYAGINVDKITPEEVGSLLAFFHYLAVYASLLRGVNPYDQPQVEASKRISYRLRMDYDRQG
ncbi:MAG: hypothetical protein AB1797_06265 [bacterium]